MGPGDLGHLPLTRVVLGPLDTDGLDTRDATLAVVYEALAEHTELARVLAELRGRLLVTVVDAEDPRPFGPGVVVGTLGRRLGQQLEVDHEVAAVANRRADAVGAGVAATDDDHVLVLGADVLRVLELQSSRLLVFSSRNSIAKWMPSSSRPGIGKSRGRVAPAARTIASFSRRIFLDIDVDADVRVRHELDAFGSQEVDAAFDDALVELHVRNAVHQQAADAVVPLVDGHARARLG